MTSNGDLKTMNGNAMLTPTLCLYVHKGSLQEDGQSSDLDQRKSGTLLVKTVHKENGRELQSK